MLTHTTAQAALFRSMAWHNVETSEAMFQWFGAKPDFARWPDGAITSGWGSPWKPLGKTILLNHVEPVEHAIEMIKKHRPSYVSAKPNSLLELAQACSAQKEEIKLKGMFAFAAATNEITREECFRVFGCPILSLYASKEVYNIAHQCEVEQSHHHANWELMLIEVLDQNGRPCSPGQSGRLVVTPFYNTAQPFIRYEQGDMVTLGTTCSCGRTLPVIERIDGRIFHMFRLPGGRKMSLRLPAFTRNLIGALDWQLAQIGEETVEVRYVKRQEPQPDGFDELTRTIQSQMTPKTQVLYKLMQQLPKTPAGKVLEVVCELPPEA
jgi:phenylacetate-CoA ligase